MHPTRNDYVIWRGKFSDEYIVIFNDNGSFFSFFDSADFLNNHGFLADRQFYIGGKGSGAQDFQLPNGVMPLYLEADDRWCGVLKKDLVPEEHPPLFLDATRDNYRVMRKKFGNDYIIIFEEEQNKFRTFFDSAEALQKALGIRTYNARGGIGIQFYRSQLPDSVTLYYINQGENCFGILKDDLVLELNNIYEESSEAEEEFESVPIEIYYTSEQEIIRSCYNCRYQYISDKCDSPISMQVCENWRYKPEVSRDAYDENNRRRNAQGRDINPDFFQSTYYRPE